VVRENKGQEVTRQADSSCDRTMSGPQSASECWHSIILRGLNSATYKMALARCLAESVEQGRSRVSWDELAGAFLDLYIDRLENGMPQLSDPYAETVMGGIVRRYNKHELTRAEAIRQVKSRAFRDVVPSFHMVDGREVPVRFYTVDDNGLSLTEDARRVMTREGELHTARGS